MTEQYRKPGWYWIQVLEEGIWLPCRWHVSTDGDVGWVGRAYDFAPFQIGPRIEPHTEAALQAANERMSRLERALRDVEGDLHMLRVAINSGDPYRELLIRVGDMERVVNTALSPTPNTAGPQE